MVLDIFSNDRRDVSDLCAILLVVKLTDGVYHWKDICHVVCAKTSMDFRLSTSQYALQRYVRDMQVIR
jgi:hypothetical protein